MVARPGTRRGGINGWRWRQGRKRRLKAALVAAAAGQPAADAAVEPDGAADDGRTDDEIEGGAEQCVEQPYGDRADDEQCDDDGDGPCEDSTHAFSMRPPGGGRIGEVTRVRRPAPRTAGRLQQRGVGAGLDDPAVVEHRDLVGVAHGRQPVRDGDRGAAARPARRTRAARPARSRCPARWSPRRGPGRAGRAAACGRWRCAASRRRRTGGRGSRPSCRSRRAAPAIRSWIWAARAAASISASVASGLA